MLVSLSAEFLARNEPTFPILIELGTDSQSRSGSFACTLIFGAPDEATLAWLSLPLTVSRELSTLTFSLDGSVQIVMTKPFANEIPEILSTIQSALCFSASGSLCHTLASLALPLRLSKSVCAMSECHFSPFGSNFNFLCTRFLSLSLSFLLSPLSANIHYLSHMITVILDSKLLTLLPSSLSSLVDFGDRQIKRQCWIMLTTRTTLHQKICSVSSIMYFKTDIADNQLLSSHSITAKPF